MDIDYSVVIRTIGKAGEKYQKLLDSIAGLVPRPKAVIVVLPEGYDLPEERLGWESFCFSQKGMVPQRVTGIENCQTRYALVCDDDVSFASDFVEKLYEPVRQGLGAFSVGPLYSFLPPKGANALLCTVMAAASPTFFHRRDRYVSVLRSSGYSYNRHLAPGRYYETQSAAGTCFFADVSKWKEIEFEKEIWLDANGYAALEDQTMFYKAWLQGKKTMVVSDAVYEHMDAKTSTRNNKPAVRYSMQYNRLVFWHRFIYSQQKIRALSVLCYIYRLLWELAYTLVNLARKRSTVDDWKVMAAGWRDGWTYIHSEEYASLSRVK